ICLPTRDIPVAALAALAIVGAVRQEIVVAMIARPLVTIDPLPGVKEHIPAFDIGPIPAVNLGWCLYKRVKPLLLGRIATDIQLEQIERSSETLNLSARGVLLGPIQIFQELRNRDGTQKHDNRQNDEEFDKRIAFL